MNTGRNSKHMNTGRNSKQTTCLCRDTGGKGTLPAQRSMLLLLTNTPDAFIASEDNMPLLLLLLLF